MESFLSLNTACAKGKVFKVESKRAPRLTVLTVISLQRYQLNKGGLCKVRAVEHLVSDKNPQETHRLGNRGKKANSMKTSKP